MAIEERIEKLEEMVIKISDQVELAKKEKWVTPAELAKIMDCSVNNVYIKIRAGEIYATDKLGAIKRIPMSQFYKNSANKLEAVKKDAKTRSIKEQVFGIC